MALSTLAIDVGGTNFSVGLFVDDKLVHSEKRATYRDGGPRWMLDQIEETVQGWRLDAPLRGCGIGFGGPVDFKQQRVIYSTHVAGWDDFDFVGEVGARFHVPAVIDRDSLLGALGEGVFGAGRGTRPIFYVTLSTGIGGGFLQEGGLFRGADSFACEIGHHTIVPDGPECLCGSNGCLERMCSGIWLERDHGRTPQALFDDPEFMSRYATLLARGLKNCIMLFNPARLVIGGGIASAGEKLFGPLRTELRRQVPAWSKARLDLVPAELGRHTILWGALALAQQELYGHELPGRSR